MLSIRRIIKKCGRPTYKITPPHRVKKVTDKKTEVKPVTKQKEEINENKIETVKNEIVEVIEDKVENIEDGVKKNKNKSRKNKNAMITEEQITSAENVANVLNNKKVIKKDKGLIERTESSKIILTEDNRQLLND